MIELLGLALLFLLGAIVGAVGMLAFVVIAANRGSL